MVAQKYRWDFIGLSTDQKPTASTSEKVVDGSTYYCSDTSKLYVWCKDNWYERKPLGGGGGGGSYTAGDGIDITNAVISATNTGLAKELTTADYNYPVDNPTYVALWLLPPGVYYRKSNNVAVRTKTASSGATDVSNMNIFAIGGDTESNHSLLAIGNEKIRTTLLAADGGDTSGYPKVFLNTSMIVDNLTSTSTDAPLSANQGKVLKDLVDSIAVRGAGAPTSTTVGAVGTLYEDTTNGDLYICTDATNPYVWEEVGAAGGPTVVQTPGTSTTDVMSQNAVTSMVFADPATQFKIKIGAGTSTNEGTGAVEIGHNAGAKANNSVALGSVSSVEGVASVAIGSSTYVKSGRSIAIGYNAAIGNASYAGGIALGAYSSATAQGEMNIGSSNTSYGYNSSNYRLLTGLYDGQSDHDAATVGQLKMGVLSTTPTGTTVGFPGRLYTLDTGGGSYEVYLCVHDNGDNTYVWKQVSLV